MKKIPGLLLMLLFLLQALPAKTQTSCPECSRCKGTGMIHHKCPTKVVIRYGECEPWDEICPACNGTKRYCPPPPPPPPKPCYCDCTCTSCQGSGTVGRWRIGMEEPIEVACKNCGGDGKVCQ